MQVNHQIIHQQKTMPDAPLELKQGEVYRASIKEKINDTDAILNIRGKEVHARFSDGVPTSENRVAIQVNGQSDKLVNVKTITTENAKTSTSEEKIFTSLGLTGKESPDVKQAVRILLDKGAPLSKEIVGELKEFMEKTSGTLDAKLETVRALANKRLEATGTQLRAVHEALNGKPLNEVLSSIAKEIDPDFKLKKTETASVKSQNQNLQKDSVLALKATENQQAIVNRTSNNVTEGMKPSQNPSTTNASEQSNLVRKSLELLESEPDLKKAINQIREEIVKNPKIDRDLTQKIEKAAQEAEKLQTIGRERLVQVLKGAEEQLLKKEQQTFQTNVTANQTKDNITNSNQELKLSTLVENIKLEVTKDPSLNRSIEKIKDQIVENPRFPKELTEKVNRALNEATSLKKQGRITTGKEVLNKILTDVQNTVDQVEGKVSQQGNVEQSKAVTRIQQDRSTTELRPSEIIKETRAEVRSEPNIQKTAEKVREQVVSNPKIDREVAQKVEQALKEATQLQKIGQETAGRDRVQQALAKAEVELKQIESRQPVQQTQVAQSDRVSPELRSSEVVKQVRVEVQSEPNLQRAVEKVRDQVVANPKMDREVAQKVEQVLKEATQLQKVGQETVGRERIQQALAKAEVELKQIESRQIAQATQASQIDQETIEPRPSEVVKQVKAEVQSEPNLQRAVEQVREQVVSNPKMDREVAQKVEQVLKEATLLQKVGQEQAGRDRFQQALVKAEVELKQIETRQPTQAIQVTQTDQDTVELRASEVVKQVRSEVQNEPNLQRAVEKVREQVVSNPKMDREVAQKVEQALKEATQLQQMGRESTGRDRVQQVLTKVEVELKQIETRQPTRAIQVTQTYQDTVELRASEVVKQVRSEVQNEPNLQRVVEKVREQVVSNPKMDREVAQKVDQALKEATQLQQIGRESTGRDRVQQVLAKAEVELKQIETRQSVQPTQQQAQPAQDSQLRESIKQVREQIQTEPDTQKILQKVQDLVTNNKNMDQETKHNIERIANQANQLDQAGRERLTKMLQQVETTLLKQNQMQQNVSSTIPKEQSIINQSQQQNSAIEQINKNEISSSQSINQALKQLQKEPNLEQALNQVRKEITSNPNIDLKTIDKAEKALSQATQLQDKGREIAARQHITKELTEIQQELAKTEPKINTEQKSLQEQMQYDLNEQMQSLNIQSKDILVTKVTQKLAQATHDFRELKREITRNLDNVERVINTFKKNSYPQAKQMLETAISKLDNAILKSDMMLFTDMKTEKQLMNASTQLAEAKKLLAKGDHDQAGKIVNEVKTLVDKLIFKPSEQKIMHYVNKESMALGTNSPSQQMLTKYSDATHGTVNQEPSARQMYEMVRTLGLNHESDVANSLVFQKNDHSHQEQQQQQENLKSVLMKLAQGEGQESNPKVAQQAEQALTNLTGQQLLSKSDASGTLQSMFFNLPLMLGGKPENLQVFINSKNEGQQVEWENCNLYFLLETKKLGDVGILLNSTDRNLSITIKNDLPGFKEKIEPLASFTKEKLQEVGYNVSSINFARMSPVVSQQPARNEANQERLTRQVFTEKGMDFTI